MPSLIGGLLSLGLLLTAAPGAMAADRSLLKAMEEEIASLMEKNRTSVVSVHSVVRESAGAGALPGFPVRRTVGSGVVFDGHGHVVTTSEVIEGAEYIQVSLASGQLVEADMVAVDEESRVAVIRLKEPFPRYPRFGDSGKTRTGHYAFVIGNAYGKMAPSVGTVVDFHSDDDLIQISGSAWPGNSGAAVFNSDGQVIGIVRGILAPIAPEEAAGPNEAGVGGWIPATLLAIPINHVRQVAQRLISGGWLGVEVERHGVTAISRVEDGGPASEAGMRVGDEVLLYNGEQIRDGDHLRRLVTATPVGSQVFIGLLRGDQKVTCRVRIDHRPAQTSRGLLNGLPASVDAGRPRIDLDSPEMLLQRIRDLEQQMQIFIQQQVSEKKN